MYLFLLVPNDSGSTWLQNIISLCANCISFPAGLDGKGACGKSGAYPSMKISKLFSEKRDLWETPDKWDWDAIKSLWNDTWSQSEHYQTADPKIYLEKTPQAIFASDMYAQQFDDVCFVIMTRSPYAVVEGMRRTIHHTDVSIKRCARHWIRCAQRQIYNYATYKNISIELTYEELVNDPESIENKIRQLVPALHDIDLTKEAVAHSLEGIKSKPLTDFNARQIQNLSAEDVEVINKELKRVPKVLDYFGYEIYAPEVIQDG
jgi:hypothetical protein